MMSPEYQHVLINSFPVHGTLVAALMLGISMALHSRQGQMIALGILVLLGPVTWAVMETGDHAKHRVTLTMNEEGQDWIKEHEKRADQGAWVLFLTAAVALAAWVSWWRYHASSRALTIAALMLSLLAIRTAAWISQAGGQIRHTEFRHGPPPGLAPH
jgi:hypothetical protein